MHPILETYFRFIKRTFLSRGEDAVIGLDVGSSACHAVELRRRQDAFELVRWAQDPVEGVDEKASLNRVMDRMGPAARTRPCVVAVSGKGILIRHVDMPRMSESDLRKAFDMEADKYFPFPKETVHLDCCILDPRGKEKRMSVLVAAVKKDIVDARLKMLKDCGIVPEVLTAAPVAVANMFAAFPPPMCAASSLDGKAVAVVDVGDTLTNLMIMAGGYPRFTRDIFIGVADIWRRLSNVMGLPVPEIMKLHAQPVAGASGMQEQLRQSIEVVLGNIMAEVRLSFDYFNTEKNLPVGRICLMGEGLALPGVEAAFGAYFDIPFVEWNPAGMLLMAQDADKDGFVHHGRRMSVALGLALSHYD